MVLSVAPFLCDRPSSASRACTKVHPVANGQSSRSILLDSIWSESTPKKQDIEIIGARKTPKDQESCIIGARKTPKDQEI